MQKHIYKRYDTELNKLRDQVAGMGDMVSKQLDLMLANLHDNSDERFEDVIENDVTINGMEVKASKTVIKLLAKRAPMGKDLRMIIASSRMVTELERIGDEIVSMAKSLRNSGELGICGDKSVVETLEGLISTAMNLLDRALLAAQNEDVDSANNLIRDYVKKGGPYHQQAHELITCVEEHYDSSQKSFYAAMLVNALMRISDHICNICEHIIFLVLGEDVRH